MVLGLYKILRDTLDKDILIFPQSEKEATGSEGKTEEKKPTDEEVKTEDKDKKVKSQKKVKISEEIDVELQIYDVLNPSPDEIDSSKKK